MTERNEWKPVAHDLSRCDTMPIGDSGDAPCTCNKGTRWVGYGDRRRDWRGVLALCAWFGAMREPAGWLFQHEETGNVFMVDVQQVEWGYERLNPRHQKIAPLYTASTMLAAQQPKKEV